MPGSPPAPPSTPTTQILTREILRFESRLQRGPEESSGGDRVQRGFPGAAVPGTERVGGSVPSRDPPGEWGSEVAAWGAAPHSTLLPPCPVPVRLRCRAPPPCTVTCGEKGRAGGCRATVPRIPGTPHPRDPPSTVSPAASIPSGSASLGAGVRDATCPAESQGRAALGNTEPRDPPPRSAATLSPQGGTYGMTVA